VKAIIDGYLDRTNALLLVSTHVRVCTGASPQTLTTLSRNDCNRVDMLGVRVHQQSVRFQAWLGRSASALPMCGTDGSQRARLSARKWQSRAT
jgi:hypothetical protein